MSSSSKESSSLRASKSAGRCRIPLGRGPDRHDSLSSTTAALQQCNDLVALQNSLLQDSFKRKKEVVDHSVLERERCEEICKDLEREKLEHAKTKGLLAAEQEKAQLALTEVSVLTRQLDREKATFEKAFGLLKSQALSDSTKSETLLAKSSALESLIGNKDDTIARLEEQVKEMTARIREMKKTHKMELQEAHVHTQQEIYLAKHLLFKEEGKPSRGGGGSSSAASSRWRGKPKLKDS